MIKLYLFIVGYYGLYPRLNLSKTLLLLNVKKRRKKKSFRLKMKKRRQKRNTKGILKIIKLGNKNV